MLSHTLANQQESMPSNRYFNRRNVSEINPALVHAWGDAFILKSAAYSGGIMRFNQRHRTNGTVSLMCLKGPCLSDLNGSIDEQVKRACTFFVNKRYGGYEKVLYQLWQTRPL